VSRGSPVVDPNKNSGFSQLPGAANTLEQPAYIRQEVRGVAKRFTFDNVALICVIQTPFRVLSWCCVILLAVLPSLPA